ncbi:hypothetical protein D3C80_1674180 [compost metagenome]
MSIGRPASIPACASLPGRRKSSLDRLAPDAFRPRPAKLANTISESRWKLPIRKAKNPTNKVFLTSRARMSSDGPQAQNSAARVTSMTIRVVATKATSPPSRPTPLSM